MGMGHPCRGLWGTVAEPSMGTGSEAGLREAAGLVRAFTQDGLTLCSSGLRRLHPDQCECSVSGCAGPLPGL